MEARIELMVGHSSMQHLKVCQIWHKDGIKFDLGSYSWYFYPFTELEFERAPLWQHLFFSLKFKTEIFRFLHNTS